MSPSQASEKSAVQVVLGPLLSSSLKISDKPVKGLCDMPVEVLEKICRQLLGDQLLEFDSPTFETKRSKLSFTSYRMPLPHDIDAASERYEAVRLDAGAGAKISPWDAASSGSQDIAIANNWAGTALVPPHMQLQFTKDIRVTKLDLGAMATCWKLRATAIRVFWSTNIFWFENPVIFRDFISYHSLEILRQIRHLNILFHPIMTLARWWNAAFDRRGKSAIKVFTNLDTLHVTLTPRCDGKEPWATLTKVCAIPVLKFRKANFSHVPLTIGRARYEKWGDPELARDMMKTFGFGLATGDSFLEDVQWQLSHGITAERGKLLVVAYGDTVDWRPSVFPFEAPKFPFPVEVADMEMDLPAPEHSDDEDYD